VKLHKADVAAAISWIASGGLAATAVAFGTLVPHYETQILAISAIIVGIAGLLARLFSNPSPPSGTTPVLQQKVDQ
jgi:ABC-type branched-subunit amino acid transport system permease subunit